MLTVQELITHLKDETHHNVFVTGPYIGSYALLNEEEANTFTLKQLVKDTNAFMTLLNHKILTPCNALNDCLDFFKPYTHKLYAQTINGNLNPEHLEVCFLKGNAKTYQCSACHKPYTYEEIANINDKRCECGRIIRPNCLLTQEKYDLSLIEKYEQDLDKADTIFLIGFDFNEIELCKQLEIIAAKKGSGDKGPIVVVVGECDKEAVYETFYPEFIVDEKPETALKRLIELF